MSLLAEVIRQGIVEMVFAIDYPQEISEILLISINFLFDESIFTWNEEQFGSRLEVMQDLFETSLRVEKETLRFLYEGFAGL